MHARKRAVVLLTGHLSVVTNTQPTEDPLKQTGGMSWTKQRVWSLCTLLHAHRHKHTPRLGTLQRPAGGQAIHLRLLLMWRIRQMGLNHPWRINNIKATWNHNNATWAQKCFITTNNYSVRGHPNQLILLWNQSSYRPCKKKIDLS